MRSFTWALIAAAMILGRTARAESPTTEQARAYANEGMALLEKGDHAGAVDRLTRAANLHRAPTVRLWLGRALVRTGRLAEAEQVFEAAAKADLKPGDPVLFAQAVRDAATELVVLTPRVPTLTISAPPGTSRVTLDGRVMPAAELRTALRLNPGPHVVGGPGVAAASFTLAEGEQKTLGLLPLGAPADRPVQWRLPTGIALLGAGVALGVTGGVAAAQVRSAQNALLSARLGLPSSVDVCVGATGALADTCAKGHTFQVVELVAFPAAAVLTGVGVYLTVSGARAKPPAVALLPSVGPGFRGLTLAGSY